MSTDTRSQNRRIAAWLKAGKTINPMLALERFGSFRLGARIHNLRAEGMNIISERVTDQRSGKHWSEYRLEKNDA